MYSSIHTAIIQGIRAVPVTVEVDISEGMPIFNMVGSLTAEVREAKERVRTALHNYGIQLPAKRITINLSPGDIRKSGTGFDLPIAVGILCSMGLVEEEKCVGRLFAGELSLNGQILGVNGVLPMVSDAKENGLEEFVVPSENLTEAELVNGIRAFGFDNLKELMEFLNGAPYKKPEIQGQEERHERAGLDFADVNGQLFLKRACEVAAAGMHNVLMVGPPGAGKTMISERMATILPPLTEAEQLEVSKIYSVAGLLSSKSSLISQRPFRNPHHTISPVGLSGGGTYPRPGEISLAHRGVLFLDEFTEFQKNTVEILRQPLEERKIRIVRAFGSVEYPAGFLLLAAMNPCPCGYYPDMQKCRCTPGSRKRYMERVSQPLIDRIDICVEASPLSYGDLTESQKNETSARIRQRVVACQQIQKERYENEAFSHNSQIPAGRLGEYCFLGKTQQTYMENIYERMSLTGRTYHKILRVARTIADLEEKKEITMAHLNEAICYRSIGDKFWGGAL